MPWKNKQFSCCVSSLSSLSQRLAAITALRTLWPVISSLRRRPHQVAGTDKTLELTFVDFVVDVATSRPFKGSLHAAFKSSPTLVTSREFHHHHSQPEGKEICLALPNPLPTESKSSSPLSGKNDLLSTLSVHFAQNNRDRRNHRCS